MSRLFSLALVLLAFVTPHTEAAPATSNSLGLQISLTTDVSRFEIPTTTTTTTPTLRRTAVAARTGFTAAVALANRSHTDLTLTYADAGAAAARFKFSLLDSTGAVLWESESSTATTGTAADPTAVSVTVPAHGTLRRTVQIPLKTSDGQWIPTGRYTVRAEAGAGEVAALVPFEVAAAPPAGASGGIQGQVFFQAFSLHPVSPASPSASGIVAIDTGGGLINPDTPVPIQAQVEITEIRDPQGSYDHPPFSWSGTTDANGKYSVATPAGTFRVNAHSDEVTSAVPFLPIFRPVTVVAGQYSTQNITIYGQRRSAGTLVYDVTSATVETLSNGDLHISAAGHATSTGWTNPQLVQRPSTAASELDLDFVAVPPTGIAGQVVLPISAETTIANTGHWTKVRVRASQGSVDATFVTTP